jgi:hypothetical protein
MDFTFPTYVGHRRRLVSDQEDLFQDSTYAHDEETRHAAHLAAQGQPVALAKDAASDLIHRYECLECHVSLPTAHLLDLHVSEMHDSFFAAQAARRMSVYPCLVEACGRTFCTVEERRQHLVDLHRFPKQYSFDRLHLRRKKGQIRPLRQYQKSNLRRAERGEPYVEESTAAHMGDVERNAQGNELLEGFSRLRMAAETSEIPARLSFGRKRNERGLPGFGHLKAGGEARAQHQHTGRELDKRTGAVKAGVDTTAMQGGGE